MANRIETWIDEVRTHGHKVWVAGPAPSEALHEIEEFIGGALPPSYASFLLSHGAVAIYDDLVSGVVTAGPDGECGGGAIHDTKRLRSEYPVPQGFLVVGRHEDGAYCLDFNRRRQDGECPVVNFEWPSIQHEKPVAPTFLEWIENFIFRTWAENDA